MSAMPGLTGLSFGSASFNTCSADNQLDPILESFVKRFQQVERGDEEKSKLLKVRLAFLSTPLS
jgi:hypothetical protein